MDSNENTMSRHYDSLLRTPNSSPRQTTEVVAHRLHLGRKTWLCCCGGGQHCGRRQNGLWQALAEPHLALIDEISPIGFCEVADVIKELWE